MFWLMVFHDLQPAIITSTINFLSFLSFKNSFCFILKFNVLCSYKLMRKLNEKEFVCLYNALYLICVRNRKNHIPLLALLLWPQFTVPSHSTFLRKTIMLISVILSVESLEIQKVPRSQKYHKSRFVFHGPRATRSHNMQEKVSFVCIADLRIIFAPRMHEPADVSSERKV